ncbi:uncharacterized protein LOC117300069 [Asterias rubens]|uniref:uncharacterized protein LOC117300069 n=1 Tax=Asterias rubens TaxID=7604 RepID=UPI001455A5C9|nr:uncharacterized protein LOC117300069 [Asterias rubens]
MDSHMDTDGGRSHGNVPKGVDVLDNKTIEKVARKVGKRLLDLAEQLQAKIVVKDVSDSLDDPIPSFGQALQTLDAWRQTFNRLNLVETLWKAALAVGIDLSQELEPLQQNPLCPCGNNESLKFRRYFGYSPNEQYPLIGICCVPCGQEWLEDKYLFHPDLNNTRPSIEVYGTTLKKQLKVPVEKSPIFPENGFRQEIGLSDVLKVGDHIAWERPYYIWHHAIVSAVNKVSSGVISVIHWNKVNWGCCLKQIMEEEICLDDQKGTLHRHEYGEEMTNANPTELVMARAKCRVGDNGYSVANDNCESFASHCKIGVAESSQKKWFCEKVKEVAEQSIKAITGHVLVHIGDIAGNVGNLAEWELVEQVANAHSEVGISLEESLARLSLNKTEAYIIIAMAGFACVLDLSESYKQRKQDKLSLKDFAQIVTLKVSAALVGAGLAVYLGRGGVEGPADGWTFQFPGLGMSIGGFIGWFVGDSISKTAVKSAGSFIGPPIGRAIARAIGGTDDRDVRIVDLYPGDQIVVFANLLHPRHHAIVVSCNQESKKVMVIHSTYEKGIVEEEVDFRDPVYRVIYNDQDCYPPDRVITRARSKSVHGVYEYSLVLNNCKHFAQWCKLKK